MRLLTRTGLVLIAVLVSFVAAGQVSPRVQDDGFLRAKAAPTPKPIPIPNQISREDQEPERVFTEEVLLPVVAYDEFGNFDPTLSPVDLIVFEDGVQQEIKSIRRIPASALVVLQTSGEMNPAIRTNTTKEVALRLVNSLLASDQVAVMQFGDRVEVVQDWTTDRKLVAQSISKRVSSMDGARIAAAVKAAAAMFRTQPVGNRHLILVTDGVEVPLGRATYKEALSILSDKQAIEGYRAEWNAAVADLLAAQVTVHIISYTEFGRLVLKGKKGKYKGSNAPVGSVLSSGIQNAGIDPTMPPNARNDPAFGTGINFDPQMRRVRKAYEAATKRSEKQLAALAEETGAKIVTPVNANEMVDKAAQAAREIDAQYVITYLPKRPLVDAKPGEYRRIQIATRRSSLNVQTRRGYIAAPAK